MKTILLKGQSLFEVVIAIAISALIVTAIVALATSSIQNSSFSRDKTIATSYAEETMEWLRQERDQNNTVFVGKAIPDTNYCLVSLSWPIAGNCGANQVITGTKFIRTLSFLTCNSCPVNFIEIMVDVSWRDSKGLHSVSSSTDLSLE